MLKDIFLLRTGAIKSQRFTMGAALLLTVNSLVFAVQMTSLFFLHGGCFLNELKINNSYKIVAHYFFETPFLLFAVAWVVGFILLAWIVSKFVDHSTSTVLARLVLRSATYLPAIFVAIWYIDIPYSDQFICKTFHDRGIRSFHIVPPFLAYTALSLAVELRSLKRKL